MTYKEKHRRAVASYDRAERVLTKVTTEDLRDTLAQAGYKSEFSRHWKLAMLFDRNGREVVENITWAVVVFADARVYVDAVQILAVRKHGVYYQVLDASRAMYEASFVATFDTQADAESARDAIDKILSL